MANNKVQPKGEFTRDGLMIIEPKEYKQLAHESTLTFKNAYVNYARFHADDVNTWIHIVFIPTLLTTQAALIRMYCTENRDLKIGMDGSVALGTFDTFKDNEQVFMLWELFMMFLCVIYIRCDVLTGICCCIMVAT